MTDRLCDYFVTLLLKGWEPAPDTREVRPVPALATAFALALALAMPSAAPAAPYTAPGGKVLWGGQGGYKPGNISDFARRSGKAPAVYNYFIAWEGRDPAMHWLSFRLDDARAHGARAMLSIGTEGSALSPAAIARGEGDTFLVRLNGLLAEHGDVVYVRPLSEMNNGNNPYSAYDLSGRSRGAAFSTGQFKRAWRRLALILRGGEVAAIDSRLRRLGMAPLGGGGERLPRAKVALMWVPLSFGNPEIARNHPRFWWPGEGYVDWVGTTWYSPFKASSAMHSVYSHPLWDDKPFVFAEWGVWGRDDPGFVRQFFGFMKSHPRVRMAVYYQSGLLSPEFRLSTHPGTSAALRRMVRWPRLAGAAAG
jgi:hypothetical protein